MFRSVAAPARREGGFATGVALLFIALLSAIGFSIMNLNSSFTVSGIDEDQRLLLFYNTANVVENSIYVFGQNDEAWRQTLLRNKSQGRMLCIDSGVPCPRPSTLVRASNPANPNTLSNRDVELFNADGSRFYSYRTQGFRLDGTVCEYDRNRVHNNGPISRQGCVFRVRVRWYPACEVNCLVGPNRITFYVEYESPPVARGGINFNKDVVNKIIAPKNLWR